MVINISLKDLASVNSDYAALFPTDEYIHIAGFLTKPVSPDTLLEYMSRLLG